MHTDFIVNKFTQLVRENQLNYDAISNYDKP